MEILFSYNGCFGVVRRCENRYSNFFEAAFVNESLGSKIQAFSIKRDKGDDEAMEVAASQEDHEVLCVPDRANPWHSNASLFVRLFSSRGRIILCHGITLRTPVVVYLRANRSSKRAPLLASQ